MKKTWTELHIVVPAAGIDLVSSELADLGCEGITVEERQLDTFIPPDPNEAMSGDYRIKAYFPVGGNLSDLQYEVRQRLEYLVPMVPGLQALTPEAFPVTNEDWAEGWKQHFSTVRIGSRLVIKPSWEDLEATPEDAVVEIDPGMAFGTGTHGTTRLCLEALSDLFEGPSLPQRVLDVGTGSGILAIAAAKLGASRVLACDIEEESCRIAQANCDLNGVGARVEITGAPLESLEGDFHIVVANILAEENARLADQLVSRLAPGGALVLSGILQEKEPLVQAAFAPYPLSGPEISRREEWSCLVYRKV
ncbi:[50S ribosomal protein L11]-lysine N-methyltransferase [Desulfuromonas soudanensis]|uniref:Ribosomal protein L11 methyltransferase n=1 Tax=Desulfuromonas soudanensis TaxID=1603606 RepID=A0A0M4D3Q4_9BACT|nr:50S ribosomal protein L11 methyltransferase [Desulfuromonas soudanensis]ALC17871.1 [50S ribosomal protein L11]-lysine N-methyltransferase [Desulfuromonas soudanensis]